MHIESPPRWRLKAFLWDSSLLDYFDMSNDVEALRRDGCSTPTSIAFENLGGFAPIREKKPTIMVGYVIRCRTPTCIGLHLLLLSATFLETVLGIVSD